MVQLSHPYMTIRQNIALTRWTLVIKVMSLHFNMLSRLVIAFLPKSKHLLISWLLSPSAVIWEPKKRVCHYCHCFPIYLPWSDGTRCHDLILWMLSFKPTSPLSSVQFSCSVISDSFDPMNHSMPGLPVHHQFLESTQTHVHCVGDAIQHLILCCPLLLLPSIFPSIRVFSNESALRISWPKYGTFSFNISPSNQYTGLISFRMDWLDLLAVQGTLKSHLQHHSSKASILRHSGFFIIQLSHPYLTTGKTIALTRRTFVDKVMSLLFICCLVGHNFPSKEQASFNLMAAITSHSDSLDKIF